MKDKDIEIIKDNALVIADALVATLGTEVVLAWNMAKALFGAGMKLRENRALDFIEFIKANPTIFIKEILATEEFQDAFVFTLENFLRERSEEKREIMKNIFVGFTTADSKENFPLERYFHTLTQLSELDIEAFSKVDPERVDPNYLLEDLQDKYTQSLYNLINLGILSDKTGSRMGYAGNAPYINMTEFGKAFRLYLIG
jgi:hypothetical protein